MFSLDIRRENEEKGLGAKNATGNGIVEWVGRKCGGAGLRTRPRRTGSGHAPVLGR